MWDAAYRKTVLNIAQNPLLERLIRHKGWSLAQRFVAGRNITEALPALDTLKQQGVHSILDLLGEMVHSSEQAGIFTQRILEMIDVLADQSVSGYISIKLSQIGQGLLHPSGEDLGLCYARHILTKAKMHGIFVCLDMEDHSRTDLTLAQFQTLHSEFGDTVGTVLQAYLYRSEQDLLRLIPLKARLRFVKGAYLESSKVAYSSKADVDANYLRLVFQYLKHGGYAAVATHDPRMIKRVQSFARFHRIPQSQYEFQMLYGIRRDLQQRLAKEGYTVRAYVPYGEDWYAYFSRRIAERPANAWFVLKGLLG